MQNEGKVFKILSLRNIWIPITIGLLVSLLLAQNKFKNVDMASYDWSKISYKPFLLSFILIGLRDILFSFRLKFLTNGTLSFAKYLSIIILWDFASAVTPSVLGGSVVTVFLLTKEGVKLGSALAAIIVTTIFDNLFFLTVSPLGYWVAYYQQNEFHTSQISGVGPGLKILFIIGVALVLVYTSLVSISMWYNPKFFKWLLVKVCTKIKFLRRWQHSAIKNGDDMMNASEHFKNKSLNFWVKVFALTAAAALCKYGVLNCLIACFKDLTFKQHLLIIGNQVLLWKVMLLSPTPGSTGTAEIFFAVLFSDILKDTILIVQILWRFITYYLQIIVGAIILSRFFKNSKLKQTTTSPLKANKVLGKNNEIIGQQEAL